MALSELQASVVCSFCRKPPDAVAKLVAGPGVFICNECVALCTELVAVPSEGSAEDRLASWHERMSDEDLLQHLPRVAAASAQVEQQLTAWVHEARGRGITWTRIGESMGRTRQSAWERFSGED